LALLLPSGAAAQQTPVVHLQGEDITLTLPTGWSVAPYADVFQLLNVSADRHDGLDVDTLDHTARIIITAERGSDHSQALRRLGEIATEVTSPATFLAVGGWPALQRRHLAPKPQPTQNEPLAGSAEETVLQTTTAVAAGELVVRLEGRLPSDAPSALADQMQTIGQSLVFPATGHPAQTDQEIQNLRTISSATTSLAPSLLREGWPSEHIASDGTSSPPAPAYARGVVDRLFALLHRLVAPLAYAQVSSPGFAQQVIVSNSGELEVIASNNARNIVVAARFGAYATSNNGGQTFTQRNGPTGFPAGTTSAGDVSLAFANSGAFYFAVIGNTPGCGGNPQRGCSTAISVSTPPDNGQNFIFRSNAVVCPNSGVNACFPDQEHMAADRLNPANTFNAGAGTGDLVYSTWRNFPGPTPMIVCSSDGGMTWPTTRVLAGDFPRVTVGQDGFVYVVYRNGGNIMLNKYTSCSAGLVQQGVAAPVGAVADITCPVPGLDRCNAGNALSSHMVAVDDTNPNHIYVGFANNTAAGTNEDILVRDSTDGGVTFPAARVVTVNNVVPGRRFMPWICATGGAAQLAWYDRRSATPCPAPPCPGMNNDLTDYFAGSAFLDAGGNLVAGQEFRVNPPGSTDPQCLLWPCQVRSMTDSESCSNQPQLGGRCCTATPCAMGDTQTPCDFNQPPACGMGPNGAETCLFDPAAGCPKYGDYNGNACAAGRLFAAWASATPPPGSAGSGGIDIFFAANVVNGPQLQVPGSVNVGDTCIGTTGTATLNLCNTGKANLEVNSITSTATPFAVTRPSSGFPVVISPDFCFPFRVQFTPTSTGTQTSTLTIANNDPANSAATVLVSGKGTQQDIRVTGSTDFGDVCAGTLAEKTISVCNVGGCDLFVRNPTVDCADFTLINNPFPATVSHDSCLDLTIRFTPTSAGSKTCTLTIGSDDPDSPTVTKTLTANTPAASIEPHDLPFPPTVLQSVGACETPLPFPVSNTGRCNLRITALGITTNPAEYGLAGLPSFPIILEPGHIVGEGDLSVVFGPEVLARNRFGALTVTYVSDPITGALTNVAGNLCGEGVRTGARLLVTENGVPKASVETIQMHRMVGNVRKKRILRSVETAHDLPLVTIPAAAPCVGFQYHREYGTVSNPIQLAPGAYRLTVAIIDGTGKRVSKTVGFDVQTCDFNANIVVNFP